MLISMDARRFALDRARNVVVVWLGFDTYESDCFADLYRRDVRKGFTFNYKGREFELTLDENQAVRDLIFRGVLDSRSISRELNAALKQVEDIKRLFQEKQSVCNYEIKQIKKRIAEEQRNYEKLMKLSELYNVNKA